MGHPGVWVTHQSLAVVEVQAPHSVFAGGVEVGASACFLWYLARLAVTVWKFSVLQGCAFPGPLSSESRVLFGLLLSAAIGYSTVGNTSLPQLPRPASLFICWFRILWCWSPEMGTKQPLNLTSKVTDFLSYKRGNYAPAFEFIRTLSLLPILLPCTVLLMHFFLKPHLTASTSIPLLFHNNQTEYQGRATGRRR